MAETDGSTPLEAVDKTDAFVELRLSALNFPESGLADFLQVSHQSAHSRLDTFSGGAEYAERARWFVDDLLMPGGPPALDQGYLEAPYVERDRPVDQEEVRREAETIGSLLLMMIGPKIGQVGGPNAEREFDRRARIAPLGELVEWVWSEHPFFRYDIRRGLRDRQMIRGLPVPGGFNFRRMVNSMMDQPE